MGFPWIFPFSILSRLFRYSFRTTCRGLQASRHGQLIGARWRVAPVVLSALLVAHRPFFHGLYRYTTIYPMSIHVYIHACIPYIHGKIHGKPIYIYIYTYISHNIYIYTYFCMYHPLQPLDAIGSIGNSSLFDHPFWESPIVGILAAEQTTSHIKNPPYNVTSRGPRVSYIRWFRTSITRI